MKLNQIIAPFLLALGWILMLPTHVGYHSAEALWFDLPDSPQLELAEGVVCSEAGEDHLLEFEPTLDKRKKNSNSFFSFPSYLQHQNQLFSQKEWMAQHQFITHILPSLSYKMRHSSASYFDIPKDLV